MESLLKGLGPGADDALYDSVKDGIARVKAATLPSEQIEAADALKRIVATRGGNGRKVKRVVGRVFGQLFEILGDENVDEDVGQTVLDVINDVCSAGDEDEVEIDPAAGPGTLSGSGGVSFDWIQAPLDNTDAILNDRERFELLLSLLIKPRPWIRMSTIELIQTCLNNRREHTEKAIEETPQGMGRLVDVLDDDREEVRNSLLLLLLQLTENNEQLQNFLAYREGFAKLFQIIEMEKNYDNHIIVQDCLSIVNNVLRGNMLTQKLFVQANHLNHIPVVLELPRVKPNNTGGAEYADGLLSQEGASNVEPGSPQSPKSTIEIDITCSPARMQSLYQGLELIANLVSGICPEELLGHSWFDPEGEFLVESSQPKRAFEIVLERRKKMNRDVALDHETIEALREQHKRQLYEMQSLVGANMQVLSAISEVALCLPSDDDLRGYSFGGDSGEPDIELSWGALRQSAFYLLGDLVVGNEANANRLLQLQVIAPQNSISSMCSVQSINLYQLSRGKGGDTEDAERSSIRSTVICGALQLALHAPSLEEKASAGYFWESILFKSSTVQIAIVGHAITPPPDDVSDESFTSKVAPSAGRFLVDSYLNSIAYSLRLDAQSHDLDWLEDISLRAGRLFEALVRDNVTCKELALHIPAGFENVGYRNTLHMNIPRIGDGQNAAVEKDTSDETTLFPQFSLDLARGARCYYEKLGQSTPGLSNFLKGVLISLFRALFEWLNGSSAVVHELLGSTSSLVLFEIVSGKLVAPGTTGDTDIESLASLCIGLCLKSLVNDSSKQVPKNVMTKEEIFNMISTRIGFEVFSDKLSKLERSMAFKLSGMSKRARNRVVKGLGRRDEAMPTIVPWYDKCFFHLYNQVKEELQMVITKYYTGGDTELTDDIGPEFTDPELLKEKYRNLVMVGEQYKIFIRTQDKEISELKKTLKAHDLLKGGVGELGQVHVDPEELEAVKRANDNLQQEKYDLQQENTRLNQANAELAQAKQEVDEQVVQLQQALATAESKLALGNQNAPTNTHYQPQNSSQLFQQQYENQFQQQQHYDQQYDQIFQDQQYDQQAFQQQPYGQQGFQQQPYDQQAFQQLPNQQLQGDQQAFQQISNQRIQEQQNDRQMHEIQEPQDQEANSMGEKPDNTVTVVLTHLIDSLRTFPRPVLLKALPDLVECLLNTSSDVPTTLGKFLMEAAELASVINDHDTALRLLEMCSPNDEDCVERKLVITKERLEKQQDPGSEREHDLSEFHRLEQEYAQVILLLANQEVSKQFLYDRINKLGGEAEVKQARRDVTLILRHAFIESE